MQYQKEDVRNSIVESAKTEFLRVGYYRASMLQISTKAKVPIGNLYRYFASKSALFDAIVGTAKEKMLEWLETGLGTNILNSSDEQDLKQQLYKVAESFLEIFRLYPKEIKLLLEKSQGSEHEGFMDTLIFKVDGLLRKQLAVFDVEENKFLFHLVAENVTRGAFRIMTDCPYEMQREELVRLLVFYFNHLEDRLY